MSRAIEDRHPGNEVLGWSGGVTPLELEGQPSDVELAQQAIETAKRGAGRIPRDLLAAAAILVGQAEDHAVEAARVLGAPKRPIGV